MITPSREQRLEAILHAYLEAVDRGEKPDRQAILDAHPDVREELAEYFADASKLDRMAKSLKTATFGVSTEEAALPKKLRYVGDYELLEEIARGGMGVVFKAKQVSLNRIVALKMIVKGEFASETDIRRFRQEAEAAANLDHPNIVPIYEVGEHEGQQYFSMKLIHVAAPNAQRNATDIASLLSKVARAVHHAHQRGILHRDLKPSNILVDRSGEPHVADFGLAKKVEGDDHATRSGAIVGTPAYMAPEQARAEKSLTTAVDVYSLGAILYEWLTGRPPFRGTDVVATLMRVATEEPASPRSINPKIVRDLETICLKCLEKEPARRYGSAAELADDLDRWRRGEPIAARPLGQIERARKWVARNPLVAALLLVIAVASLVSGFSAYRAVMEARAARLAEKYAQDRAVAEREAKQTAQAESKRAEALLYASKLSLAQSAFAENNGGLALQLLNECSWNLRGLEHSHLWTRYSAKLDLRGHQGVVESVAISPEGRRIVTAGRDKVAKVWDSETGRELFTLKGHTESVTGVAFRPDGKRIVTCSADKTAKVWDADTGMEKLTFRGHRDGIEDVAFASDGKRIVTVSSSLDRSARVWEADTGKELVEMPHLAYAVYAVAFSPDGKHIVTCPEGTIAQIWDAVSGDRAFTLGEHDTYILGVAYSPDGTRIAIASHDKTAKIYDAKSGKHTLTLKGHAAGVQSVAFSPDGTRIVTGSADESAKVWDAGTGREILTLRGHSARIRRVAFSPDGRRIATACEDHTAKLWDAEHGQEIQTLQGHAWDVLCAKISPDGNRIATGCRDGSVKVWDARTGNELLSWTAHSRVTSQITFSPDSTRILTASHGVIPSGRYIDTAKVWDAASGKLIFDLEGHSEVHGAAAFSPDGKHLVIGSADNSAKVWDAAKGTHVRTLEGHTDWILTVVYSPDSKWIATAGKDLTVKIWNAATGREIASLPGHTEQINSVAFSDDGNRIATGSSDRTVRIWDVATGRELRTLKDGSVVMGVAFSPDGSRLVTATKDLVDAGRPAVVKVWDPESGRELIALKGHAAGLNSVAFNSDGNRIITSSDDRTAKVWSIGMSQSTKTLGGHSRRFQSVAFRADGKHLFAQDDRQQVLAWSTTTGQPVEPLDPPSVFMPGLTRSPDGFLLAEPSGYFVTVMDSRQIDPNGNRWPLPDAAERTRYHTEQAADAEKAKQWFAVAFHVGRLLRDDPGNADLTRRRDQALKNLAAASK